MTERFLTLCQRRLALAANALLLGLGLVAGAAGAAEPEVTVTPPAGISAAPDRSRIVGASAIKLRNQSLRTGPGGSEAMLALPSVPPEMLALGRSIYLDGIGEGGRKVTGVRFGGVEAQGASVACASCHRRSGLGAIEGVDQVSPIAGRFILTDDPRAVVSMNYRNIHSFNQKHDAFTAGTFRAAVTQGRHLDGRDLSPIMPRYEFSETELQAVQGYLQNLSSQWSPGVNATQLHLATVITPDVSPERRDIFLSTIRAAVSQKNGNYVPGQRTMSAAEMLFRSDRFWELEVWELTGEPSTWGAQLDARMQANPVFALVSGLGAGEWSPIHQFCERAKTPCWFPSVDAPPMAARKDFYSVYFSAGVSLEADVLASRLRDAGTTARVVQLHCGDPAGRAGALHLGAALWQRKSAPKTTTREVNCGDAGQVRRALADVRAKDVLMLWWPGSALTTLQDVAPPKASAIYASSRLLGSSPERMAAAWKPRLQLLYLYQAPEKRHATLFNFEAWLKIRKLPLSDEVLQSEVYFAMSYLAETLTEMIDNVHRDYLLERAENSLSLREGQKAEDEAREAITAKHNRHAGGAQGAMARIEGGPIGDTRTPRPVPGKVSQLNIKREGTTVYPRLSLAQGQRFASKGAYLMRFGTDPSGTLEPASEWIIP